MTDNIEDGKREKITFNDVIKCYQVTSLNSFVNYLAQIWRDLAKRSSDKTQGINKLTFSKYFELPGLISERLFSVFDRDQSGFLNPKEFINGMTILFTESFNTLSKFIFSLYDFDNDGLITREDVRMVLSYVPLQAKTMVGEQGMNYENEGFSDRVESQDELFKILSVAFGDKETLNLDEFIDVIENKSSDIFLFILVYIMEKKPFNNETLKLFDAMGKDVVINLGNKAVDQKIAPPSRVSKFKSSVLIRSTQKSISVKHSKPNISAFFNANSSEDNEPIVDNIGFDKGKSKKSRFYRKPIEKEEEEEEETNMKELVAPKRRERKVLSGMMENDSIEKALLEKIEKNNHEEAEGNHSLETEVVDQNKEENLIFSDGDEEDPHKITSQISSYEGYLLKLTSSHKIKKIWFKLIHKDIYFFKKKGDLVHQGMHHLSGVYIKENEPFDYNGVKYYSFSMIFPKKTRTYYSDNEREFRKWIVKLNQAIDFKNITDLYDLHEVIGSGRFGQVKRGTLKTTQKVVAIKIMNKSEMSNQDYELVNTEMNVLKICQHPNIIKLYDIFENDENIYIIMEYCGGGDLFSYIEKRGYKLPEKRACEIIHKVCAALYYLHSYAIVHRDLKPENILMTDNTEEADIRLLDFGLSKLMGPEEKCTEPFGTLSYASPEVLQEKPYDRSVDMWSVGIITFLLLCGCLPFDDESSEKEIIRQTIQDPVPYYPRLWKNISLEARLFVDGCLQKNPKERMTVKQALEHEWFNQLNGIARMRKESNKRRNSNFGLYASIKGILDSHDVGKKSC